MNTLAFISAALQNMEVQLTGTEKAILLVVNVQHGHAEILSQAITRMKNMIMKTVNTTERQGTREC